MVRRAMVYIVSEVGICSPKFPLQTLIETCNLLVHNFCHKPYSNSKYPCTLDSHSKVDLPKQKHNAAITIPNRIPMATVGNISFIRRGSDGGHNEQATHKWNFVGDEVKAH